MLTTAEVPDNNLWVSILSVILTWEYKKHIRSSPDEPRAVPLVDLGVPGAVPPVDLVVPRAVPLVDLIMPLAVDLELADVWNSLFAR